MNCEQVQTLLGRFHDGEVDPAERAAVEVHLGDCRLCAAELAAIAELAQMTRASAEPDPPADLWNKIAGLLLDVRPNPRRSRPGVSRVWKVATVAALMLIALATGWLAHKSVAPPAPDDPTFDNLVAAHAGERMSLQEVARRVDFRVLSTADLPDGYRLEECCLCRDSCCDLVKCKFLRGTDRMLLVQCNPDHSLQYGNRPVLETKINGEPARIVQCDGYLAASWKTKDTAFSLVGISDVSELVRLVSYVDERLEGKP